MERSWDWFIVTRGHLPLYSMDRAAVGRAARYVCVCVMLCITGATHPTEVEDLGDGFGDEEDFGPVTADN